jgi:hypothetical protein
MSPCCHDGALGCRFGHLWSHSWRWTVAGWRWRQNFIQLPLKNDVTTTFDDALQVSKLLGTRGVGEQSWRLWNVQGQRSRNCPIRMSQILNLIQFDLEMSSLRLHHRNFTQTSNIVTPNGERSLRGAHLNRDEKDNSLARRW